MGRRSNPGRVPSDERAIIVAQPAKRPYGVRVHAHVARAATLKQLEASCILLGTGQFMTVSSQPQPPDAGGEKFVVTLEGFPTTEAAAEAGRRLIQSLLWMSISLNSPLRVDYRSYEQFAVFERARTDGLTLTAFGTSGWSPKAVIDVIADAYDGLDAPSPQLLLSMEIFAGAMLESSERAQFLAIVSALEPLGSSKEDLGSEVAGFVDDCLSALSTRTSIPGPLRQSLASRLRHLRNDSVGRSLRRVITQALPNWKDAVTLIDHAYTIRSEVLHTGRPADLDVDLGREGRRVAALIREMYASLVGARLLAPTGV